MAFRDWNPAGPLLQPKSYGHFKRLSTICRGVKNIFECVIFRKSRMKKSDEKHRNHEILNKT